MGMSPKTLHKNAVRSRSQLEQESQKRKPGLEHLGDRLEPSIT